MKMPRFVIGGTQSGVGKTTVSVGIMKALSKRGLNVQPYKIGPDYIDPAFHSFVTGNKSRNLDSWMLEERAINDIFVKNSFDKDISVIEGVMGLYDGFGIEKDNGSTAHVSKILKSPVVLIIDGNGVSSSAAAQVLGYKLYDEKVKIKGVIVNNVSGQKHYELIKEVIEKFTGIKCVGYLKKNIDIKLESRHLGLIPTVEVENLNKKLDKLSSMIEETIDIDEIIEISKEVSTLYYTYNNDNKTRLKDVNIGVALDKAFNFYYQDNLELLEELGAKLVYFSPLKDRKLPDNLHGLYLGGGFPEVFAKELEENRELRNEIKKVSELGMPIYAECGGLMYLCKSITTIDGKTYEMVGIFNRNARMTNKLQRFGYVHVNILKSCTISKMPTQVKAHEFHRSILDESINDNYIYRVDKIRESKIINSWKCGIVENSTLGAYAHIHFYSNKRLAEDFIENCRLFKKGSV
ncbi:cobyrinic acid a,c-diamide synthase [Caloranaerobacter azorensis DSM 13643]|uniref:Cobyrinate a,c-diamide synthase n=1 Tax=Caloranaerobacter azorensis DSM 13643 TaxID=1121264 RepID=A0A1M5SCE6_9FIRM|nr:cobyrinate a,c-diamide synthase [Caloranaerobacter azorensis]SHH36204.1 cobyrinic acid a,c-diamide synthase [Caloranaerobacter azorensis DSM 13643]